MLIIFLCSAAFASVQGETPALTPFASEMGTHLIAMPTYTYSRMPGTLGLKAEEETWRPEKWKNRRIFNRFVPMIDWEARDSSSLWFYMGNEIGDMLWQELSHVGEEVNEPPMLYGGFTTKPIGGFYVSAEFNQIDHFSEATFDIRRKRINSQKFSWFGENLPAYSLIYGSLGYVGTGDFFKKASISTGSEYLWAWDKEEWVPIRISPRVEGNASFYFMENEIYLNAAIEEFQIQDSAAKTKNNFGLRLKGKNTGGGLYASQTNDKEDIIAWMDFDYKFLQVFTNKGFIAFSSSNNRDMGFVYAYDYDPSKSFSLAFADSLEYEMKLSRTTALIPGILLNQNGVKLYGETTYKFERFFAKTRAYQNYATDFESIGFDSEIAYKSRVAEAGLAYSQEFFEYYKESAFYDIKPAESSAKMFLKYRFLENLSFAHEWVYRSKVQFGIPATWFWNMQIEQKIPKLNTSLYAVLLHALSKDNKDFAFGGLNAARFFCGLNVGL